MSKEEVDSILLVNDYLIECKCHRPTCEKTELTRKYLTSKIKKALKRRNKRSPIKAFFNFILSLLFISR